MTVKWLLLLVIVLVNLYSTPPVYAQESPNPQIEPNCSSDKPAVRVDMPDEYDRDKIIAPSFNNVVAESVGNGTVPEEVFQEVDNDQNSDSTPLPNTGVQQSFISMVLGFTCRLFQSSWCVAPVGYFPDDQTYQTKYSADITSAIAKGQSPDEAKPDPAQQDCAISDLTQQDQSLLEANQLTNDISQSDIYLSNSIPDLGISEYNELDTVMLGETAFSNDDRFRRYVCKETQFFKANYPEGTFPELRCN